MTTHVAYLNVPRRAALTRILKEFFSGLVTWYERRAAIAELRALPDHLLTDIGLDRAAIPSAVDGLLKNR